MLVEGEIVELTPIGPDHGDCVLRLNTWFWARLGDRALVSVQSALRLGDRPEPQPDVCILVPPLERRGRGEVVAPAAFADVALAVDDVLG